MAAQGARSLFSSPPTNAGLGTAPSVGDPPFLGAAVIPSLTQPSAQLLPTAAALRPAWRRSE